MRTLFLETQSHVFLCRVHPLLTIVAIVIVVIVLIACCRCNEFSGGVVVQAQRAGLCVLERIGRFEARGHKVRWRHENGGRRTHQVLAEMILEGHWCIVGG